MNPGPSPASSVDMFDAATMIARIQALTDDLAAELDRVIRTEHAAHESIMAEQRPHLTLVRNDDEGASE